MASRAGLSKSGLSTRALGETRPTYDLLRKYPGPSPRAGEKPRCDRYSQAIPVREVNTTQRLYKPWVAPDHPRSRREHNHHPPTTHRRPGPSPHAGGTLVGRLRLAALPRTIPARGRATSKTSEGRCLTQIHPRARGSHVRRQRTPPGRPVHPRARGSHATGAPSVRADRGPSPRAGEPREAKKSKLTGPSPRAGEPPARVPGLLGQARSISARGGATEVHPGEGAHLAVHPRARWSH